jgi:hypothetical protein
MTLGARKVAIAEREFTILEFFLNVWWFSELGLGRCRLSEHRVS